MQKIVSFILLLCLAIGAKAEAPRLGLTGIGDATTEPLSGELYVFKCSGQGGQTTYMCAGGNNNETLTATTTLPTGIDAMRYVWRLELEGETWKIINMATNQQLTFNGS